MSTDPNKFYDQSWQTQQDFLAVYGGGEDWEAAAKAWAKENDKNSSSSSGGKSSSSSSSSGGKSSSGGSSSGSSGSSSNSDVQKMVDYYTALSGTPFYKDYAKAQQEAAGFEVKKLDTATGLTRDQMAQSQSQFDDSLGFNRDQLAQSGQQFDQTLGFNREKLSADIQNQKDNLELERQKLEVTKGTAYADAWYKEQLVSLAVDEHARLWQQLGLDYTKAAIDYASTPDKIFQLADFNAAMKNQNAGGRAAFGGQSIGQPTPNSLAGLYAQWGIQPGATPTSAMGGAPNPNHPNPNADPHAAQPAQAAVGPAPTGFEGWDQSSLQALGGVAQTLQTGASKLPTGWWEGMNPDEKKIFLGGTARLGASPTSFLSDYALSRPAQGNSAAA